MIYTNLNNSGEVEAVYAAKRATITGTPPLSYQSKGYDLEDFLISGNTLQDGTPSPDAPVDVVGCGTWDETQQSYKLPLIVNGTEYPIYLGQVESTRKIRKLVLTGTENWDGSSKFRIPLSGQIGTIAPICTHYRGVTTASYGDLVNGTVTVNGGINLTLAIYDSANQSSLADWKSYLAAQYAAGTPVTIWYVLATPETTIINEPLHKIGNYADTISLSQSGITVTTTAGTNTITTGTTVLPSSISVTTPEKEVEEIYAGINYQNPVYYKSRTITGQAPLSYKALSKPLSDYLISGNTVQNGTPTPSNPVDVVGCGVRTENLYDRYANDTNNGFDDSGYLYEDGRISTSTRYFVSEYIPIQPNTEYTLVYSESVAKSPSVCFYDSSKSFISGKRYGGQNPFTFTTPNGTAFIRFSGVDDKKSIIMLNAGAAALPYEPYGYKLPITINSMIYLIYLGQVETTRRIGKCILTGDESYSGYDTDRHVFRVTNASAGISRLSGTIGMSTHFQQIGSQVDLTDGQFSFGTSYIYFRLDSVSYSSDFIAYVRDQYNTGTPVTVWYVLATPETAVINEPLHKIGDYADIISFAQADMVIPTVSGDNVLDIASTVKPSAVSITGNIKPTEYEKIYGVSWSGSGNTLTRTDAAANFSNPDPYVADGNHPGYSPFDNIMPWSGMVKETIDGNSVVKIPKFWYKITSSNGHPRQFQIANYPAAGFSVSPAHRDRGDGEKDFIYIGRYSSDSTYKSVSGEYPISQITRSAARSGVRSLGAGYQLLDISLLTTIQLLYLVEFANWDSQSCIGYNGGSTGNGTKTLTGASDSIPYHTGTAEADRATYNVGVQYRYIEDLWGNILQWCDGIVFNDRDIYCFEDFADYADSYSATGAVLVGTRPSSQGYIEDFSVSSVNGFEWFMNPSSTDQNSSNNIPDWYYPGDYRHDSMAVAGYDWQNQAMGLFHSNGNMTASYGIASVGARLQYVPPSS